MYYRLKPRRDKLSKWIEINPIISEGEIVFVFPDNRDDKEFTEFEYGRIKIGDGKRAFIDLPWFGVREFNNWLEKYKDTETPEFSSGICSGISKYRICLSNEDFDEMRKRESYELSQPYYTDYIFCNIIYNKNKEIEKLKQEIEELKSKL